MGCHYDGLFAGKIAELCCSHYNVVLQKTGKPQNEKEWTFMAAVLAQITTNAHEDFRVVAMGTGSKCLGQSKLTNNGDLIHDGHAEVVARRSFIRFLYRELYSVYNGGESAYIEMSPMGSRCVIKPGVSFHFYTSHVPCGDAAIFPKSETQDCKAVDDFIGHIVSSPVGWTPGEDKQKSCKRSLTEDADGHQTGKIAKLDLRKDKKVTPKSSTESLTNFGNYVKERAQGKSPQRSDLMTKEFTDVDKKMTNSMDTHRTGAKCVLGGNQDPKDAGLEYHITGVLRTKPGRGDRTLSMSCSDKLALWNIVGIQGALIGVVFEQPVYLDTITIGKCTCNMEALQRAIFERTKDVSDLPLSYHHHPIIILQDDNHTFSHSRQLVESKAHHTKTGPSSASIIWWLDGQEGRQEAIVNGRRQGVTSKNWHKPQARCYICKSELLKQFQRVTSCLSEEQRQNLKICGPEESYLNYKRCAVTYQQAKKSFLNEFSTWVLTPKDYYMFSLDSK